MEQSDTFWNDLVATDVAIRRRFQFAWGRKRGVLSLELHNHESIANVHELDSRSINSCLMPPDAVRSGAVIAPHLVFGEITEDSEYKDLWLDINSRRSMPVIQLPPPRAIRKDAVSFNAFLRAAETPLSTALLADGDCAIGWMLGGDDPAFYPIAAINVPEDIESFRLGEGTTDDILPLLPFQT